MVSPALAIRATRGGFRDAASVVAWAGRNPEAAAAFKGRSLVFFNGAFSPPTLAHSFATEAAARSHDIVWLDPEPAKSGKVAWQEETLGSRIDLCELMAAKAGAKVGVGSLRCDLGPEVGSSPELFRALRMLVGRGSGRLIWAMGADVLEGTRHWAPKARECFRAGETCDGLFLFSRASFSESSLRAVASNIGLPPCSVEFFRMPEALRQVSSAQARAALAQVSPESFSDDAALRPLYRTMLPEIAHRCLSDPLLRRAHLEQAHMWRMQQEKPNLEAPLGAA